MSLFSKRILSSVAMVTTLILAGAGCGANPTTTKPPLSKSVNACTVLTGSQIASVISGSSPTTTSNGAATASPDGYEYSNCRWNLQVANRNLDVHVETYPAAQGAHDIAVTSLSDDRAQGGGFTFTMEPNLGPEAYYRLNARTSQVNFVRGNVFYSLYLSPIDGMDATSAKTLLKNLADQVR